MAPDDFFTFQRKEKERKKKQQEEERERRKYDAEKNRDRRDPSLDPLGMMEVPSDHSQEYSELDLFADAVEITMDVMELEEAPVAAAALGGEAARASLFDGDLAEKAAELLKNGLFASDEEEEPEEEAPEEMEPEEKGPEKQNLFSMFLGIEDGIEDKTLEKKQDEDALEATEKFFKESQGEPSGKELLKGLAGLEDANSPFRKLYEKIKDADGVDPDSTKAMKDFMTEVKEFMLQEVKEEMERRKEYEKDGKEPDEGEMRRRERFDSKMDMRMSLLQKTMGESEFNDLCDQMDDIGYTVGFSIIMSALGLQQKKVTCGLTKLQEIGEKGGETAGFYRLLNSAIDFVDSGDGPEAQSAQEKLAKSAASYVIDDCGPTKLGVNQEAFYTGMYILGSVLPENTFSQFVDQLNRQPGRGIRFVTDNFLNAPALNNDAPEAAKGIEAPVLTLGDTINNIFN